MNDLETCREQILSEDTRDFISNPLRTPLFNELLKKDPCIQDAGLGYQCIYFSKELVEPISLTRFSYNSIPNCFAPVAMETLNQTGILPVQNYPALQLKGKGVLIGFLDSGIDYQNKVFRNLDGTTRIAALWDQTIQSGTPPRDFFYGSEYRKEEIDLALSSESDAVFHAYQTEDTRFVKEAYLTALKSLNATPYVDVFRKRYEELSLYEASDDEKKHVEHELHALSELINTIEPFKKHRFLGGRQTFHCIFRTNPLHPEITAALMEESSAASSKMGVRVKTNHLNRLLPIRTYNELLFQIPGMVSCKPDADVAASVIAGSNLMALLENTHEGDFPFYFRIGVKSRMALSERSKFAKKVASKLEELTAHKLRNSTSHYEFEIRMIEGKSGDYYLLVKLNTIVDRRFSYREEFIPTSIKPVNAALLVELAKDYMIPDAQILDPFCGVGTMLIERQKVVKGNTSYGIDHSPEAIEKAIYNTNLADQIVHYINKDCFTFTHDYPFDEIFTEMPYATGQKTEAEIREVYEKFFPFAKRVLGPEGTIIMYTRNREYVKQFAVKSNFRILKEIKITQRPESYLMILK